MWAIGLGRRTVRVQVTPALPVLETTWGRIKAGY